MPELPVAIAECHAYFTEGVLAAAGRHLQTEPTEVHTHGFVELAVVSAGEARTSHWRVTRSSGR